MGNRIVNPDQAAFVARQTVDKAANEAPQQFIQYGTVVGVDLTEGVVPYISVSVDGPGNGVAVAVSLIGAFFFVGMRVAVLWTPPAGLCIIGTPETSRVPYVRATRGCTESGGGGGGG